MQTSEAEKRLKAMLADAGFDMKRPNPQLAWDVFKSFMQEPVDCADDGVLFECGIYDFTGKELFTWGLVRQFSIDVDGEYDHMEQLHCTFRCAPTKELRKLEISLWAYDFGTMHEYFSKVEGLNEFQSPLQSPQNWTCEVEQWEV